METTGAPVPGGITGLVNKKLAIPNPAAVTLQDVSASLKQTLDQLLLMKQTETMADVAKGMFAKNESSNPVATLKDLGLNIGAMIETTAKMAQAATEQLYKERKEVLEEKEKAIEREKKSEAQELSATRDLLTTIINLQNKSHEDQIRLLETMYKQRLDDLQKSGVSKEDALDTVFKEIAINSIRERFEKPTPDPKMQIIDLLKTVRELQALLGINNQNQQNTDALERLERLKYDLELKKLDMELAHKREERKDKNEVIRSALSALRDIVAAIPMMRGAGTTAVAARAPNYRAICPFCGFEIEAQDPSAVTACPHCKRSFVSNAPEPPKVATEGA